MCQRVITKYKECITLDKRTTDIYERDMNIFLFSSSRRSILASWVHQTFLNAVPLYPKSRSRHRCQDNRYAAYRIKRETLLAKNVATIYTTLSECLAFRCFSKGKVT
jgi:hypothetical protein